MADKDITSLSLETNPPSQEKETTQGMDKTLSHLHDLRINPDNAPDAKPISMLPAEVLLKIFFLLLRRKGEATPPKPFLSQDPARVLSQVSRLWREAILSSTLFWRENLDWCNNAERWFKLLLERSGSQDLHIFADLTRGRDMGIRGTLLQNIKASRGQLERIKSVEIRVKHHYETKSTFIWLMSQFPVGIPSLEQVTLAYSISTCSQEMRFDINSSRSTSGAAANLQNLEITRFPEIFNVNYQYIRTLSVVDLWRNGGWPPAVPHVGKWLHILRAMPNLSDLTIKGSLGDVGSTEMLIEVCLPGLHTLSLAGYVGEQCGIETFLTHLVTPKGCNLYFAGRLKHPRSANEPNDFSLLLEGFKAWFGRWNLGDHKSTEVHSCLDVRRFIIHNQSGEKPWPGLYFRISLGWGNFSGGSFTDSELYPVQTISRSLLSTLNDSVKNTRKLTVWTCGADIAMPWNEFLSPFSSLMTLQITAGKVTRGFRPRCKDRIYQPYTVNSILSELGSSSKDKTTGLLPSLRKIVIVNPGQILTMDYSDFLEHFREELQVQHGTALDALNRALVRSGSTL